MERTITRRPAIRAAIAIEDRASSRPWEIHLEEKNLPGPSPVATGHVTHPTQSRAGQGSVNLKHILIISPESDQHAIVIAGNLRRERHEVVFFNTAHFPETARFKFDIGSGNCLSSLHVAGDTVIEEGWADVVWLRRPLSPKFNGDEYAPEDRVFMAANIAIFSGWALAAFAPNARWVNGYGAHIAASNKILQLRVANELGLNIPRTLFSNDTSALVEFLGRTSILKPIVRHRPSDLSELQAAQHVFAGDIADHGPIEPLFLQEFVDKVAEVRVHVLGKKVIAVLLRPRSRMPERVDWNFDRHNFECSKITLPIDIEKRCLALTGKLGLVFCIIDFIVDRRGDFTFLELNQMGQFLWLDEITPGIDMAKEFSRFLTDCQT